MCKNIIITDTGTACLLPDIQRYYSAVIEVAHFSIINPWGIEHETKVKFIIFCVCDTFFDVLQQRQQQQWAY